MRTQEEIVNRINEQKAEDIHCSFVVLGFEIGIYINFLDFDHARPFLKPDTTKEQWNTIYKEPTTENVLAKIQGYMPFAWEKANDCRRISANRTIAHYEAWLWLLDDGCLEIVNSIEYEHYGKEKLIAICEKYGWDWKQWDNGIRTDYG